MITTDTVNLNYNRPFYRRPSGEAGMTRAQPATRVWTGCLRVFPRDSAAVGAAVGAAVAAAVAADDSLAQSCSVAQSPAPR